MKRKILLTAVCCALALAGCTKTAMINENEKSAAANNTLVATEAEDITTDVQITADFSIPSREAFAEIPEGTEGFFDRVIQAIDKNFPKEKKDVKRYYGYLGEQQVDGTQCYVFAVYDEKDGEQKPVKTAAITSDGSRVYALNEESSQFWLLEQYSDRVPVDYSWTFTREPDEVTTSEE
jgi:hypothetical protein